MSIRRLGARLAARLCPRAFSGLFAAIAFSLAAPAQAATYRCDVNGTAYITDRPCANTPAASGNLGAIGPARPPTAQVTRPVSTGQAPEHQRFLSQRCAELNDAIRTAPARGVGHSTVAELRREYEQKCSEDDQEARRQVQDAKRKERENVASQRQQAERARQDEQLLKQRCIALQDALRGRRAETDADRATKRVAEEAYNANCLGK
jgi:hypothetical protein